MMTNHEFSKAMAAIRREALRQRRREMIAACLRVGAWFIAGAIAGAIVMLAAGWHK